MASTFEAMSIIIYLNVLFIGKGIFVISIPPINLRTSHPNISTSSTKLSITISTDFLLPMTKVSPETIIPVSVSSEKQESSGTGKNPVVLTIWKKSLLFNCDGFTVYDSNGNIVFRVDNYVAGGNGEIVLMDASGHSLHTIRRKRLSLSDNWLVYDGETTVNPRFSMTKHMNMKLLTTSKSLAYVSSAGISSNKNSRNKNAIYEIEGSYGQRCCVVNDEMRRRVAEIRRKEGMGGVVLGGDVFRLIVEPSMDPSVAMALVIIMDQMFGHSRRFRM